MSTSADSFLQRVWYGSPAHWFSLLLLPCSWLFRIVVALRRWGYRAGVLRRWRVARPVVVVGNITVGGTGKTPFTIWLAEQLAARGVRVGIVLRGYGGQGTQWPHEVRADTSWEEVGDEAKLLAARTGAIVVAGPDRVADARRAIDLGAQVVLSDDGLQHYRLGRDCEIAVIDAQRGFGNGRCLPAGPLREPPHRLREASMIVLTRRQGSRAASLAGLGDPVSVEMRLGDAISLTSGERRPLSSFAGAPVHAVAGIGNPQAFFDALTAAGLSVRAHALPDHARLSAQDIAFPDDSTVLMTEKDAVKCGGFVDARHWAVRLDIAISAADAARVQALLDRIVVARTGAQ